MRLLLLLFLLPFFIQAQITPTIKIDQFGYLPNATKIAILSDPVTGYNSTDSYTPSATLQVIDANSGAVAFTSAPVAWKSGATHITSGDKVWWFDFSAVTTTGEYYIQDIGNSISSDTFIIDTGVYRELHEITFKTFYYQRCGVAKETPYCLPGYTDAACHVGSLQDLNCRSILAPTAASELDLAGGWHDAGDYNKYVNFIWGVVIDLLLSYEYNSDAWSDDMDIPASGNYIPDVLDEVKIEMDWLLKMQQADGGVLSLVGTQSGGGSPPSADSSQRFYGPKTTSASFTAATLFAFTAVQFAKVNCAEAQAYAILMEDAAEAAYTWAEANPGLTYHNTGQLAAGEQEVDSYGTDMRHLTAAIYLWSSTGDNNYKNYVETNYTTAHMQQWGFVYPFENEIQQSLMYFAHLPGVDSGVATAIINAFKNSMDNYEFNYPAYVNELDAYRAMLSDDNHGWGSNSVKQAMGNNYQCYQYYNLDATKNDELELIIQDYLHYLHGSNPNAIVYFTNMNDYGAERSLNSLYHGWFPDGSALYDEVGVSTYGPAPGFLAGGPNPSYSYDNCCPNSCGSTQNNALCIVLSPPVNQPILKSYLDWNADWPQNSWQVTENAIYYQAAYLNLLSSQVVNTSPAISASLRSHIGNADLYISNIAKGLILHSENDSSYVVSVDNSGKINTLASNASSAAKLNQSYLQMTTAEKGIILRSPDGNHWLFKVDSDGKMATENLASIPPIKVEYSSGDFSIGDSDKGVILRNNKNECYLIKVNDAGVVVCLAVDCSGP